ncbi:hypothetical protein HID58_026298, partial [Brassica napus]
SIGLALGEVDSVDVDNGRVRVRINVDEPLQFKRKAGYANGDVINVTLYYEELHRYCYTCKRISHEEGTCPELSLEQRETNRIARLKQKEKDELAAREAFSVPIRGLEAHARNDPQARIYRTYDVDKKPLDSHRHRSDSYLTEHKQNPVHDDLRFRISDKRESLARTVWNRLDHNSAGKVPRDRERYHPYQKDLREDSRYSKRTTETPIKQGRYGDSASSSSWRVKGSSPQKQNRVQERSREWRRPDPPSRSNRSPDSQRTISESHHIQRSDSYRRRTGQHSRYEPRLEWQPVRIATRSREEQHRDVNEQTNQQEMERETETEEDRRRRIKGKAIARNAGDKEGNGNFGGEASGTLKTNDPLPDSVTVLKEIPVTQENTIQNIQSTQPQENGADVQKIPSLSSPEQAEKCDSQIPMSERLKIGLMGKQSSAQDTDLLTEEEINQMADQYASVDLEMDEDMLNEDDLLDEELEENTVIPETQELGVQPILPQHEEARAGRDVGKEKEKEKLMTKTLRPESSKEQEISKKAQKDMMPPISINKRRGARSPDKKGVAASKKLAIRGPVTWKVAQLGDEITEEEEPPAQRNQSLSPSYTRTDRRYTCQVDGSWAASDERMGMGFVILVAGEEILQGQSCTHRVQSPIHAEAEGIIWAMKEARARSLDDITFASDCQQLVNLVNRDEVWPALSTELDEIKYLLSKFQSVGLIFLPRSCNIRADSLAKGGRSRAYCFAAVNSLVPFLPALEARHEEPV